MSERHAAWAIRRRPKLEAYNLRVEEEHGVKRRLSSVTCPTCAEACPTNIAAMEKAEAGFIVYSPPRISEWATCYHCENILFYEVIHQEGVKFTVTRGGGPQDTRS